MKPNKIDTPHDFFEHVVERDFEDFKGDAIDLRLAYHACTALLSLRDWIKQSYQGKPWSAGGTVQVPFNNAMQLQVALKRLTGASLS